MPLFFYQEFSPTLQFGIWNIEEDEQKLLSYLFLNKEEFEILSNFKSEKRRKQWLSYRVLIRTLLSSDFIHRIHYDDQGRPYLTNPPRSISISHTENFSAVLISSDINLRHGLDIQILSNRIERLIPRYMSAEEIKAWKETEDLVHAHFYWTAKEAVFKVEGNKLNSLQHIYIYPFMPGTSQTFAKTSEGEYQVLFKTFRYLICAIAFKLS
ncbi:MAG: 4'-phosphopantetheinyl transferase superfamily protein [Bacteroidales bacterium]|nr:4'-phosphopantetheinyl transferase superfamily protein [Bacteroidales bacterium]